MLPYLCCGYTEIIAESRLILLRHCPAPSSDYLLNIFRLVFSDTLDLICGQHDSAEKCDKSAPHVMTVVRNMSASFREQGVPEQATTPLVPLLRVMAKLDSAFTI